MLSWQEQRMDWNATPVSTETWCVPTLDLVRFYQVRFSVWLSSKIVNTKQIFFNFAVRVVESSLLEPFDNQDHCIPVTYMTYLLNNQHSALKYSCSSTLYEETRTLFAKIIVRGRIFSELTSMNLYLLCTLFFILWMK